MMGKELTEEEILTAHGIFDLTLEHLLKCPVPFTLQMFGNGNYLAKWETAVKSEGLPEVVTGTSRTSALNAMVRLWSNLYEAGVL